MRVDADHRVLVQHRLEVAAEPVHRAVLLGGERQRLEPAVVDHLI